MKKIVLFLLMMLPMAVMAQKMTDGELIIFEKPGDVINIKSFKVSRAMDKGFAIARGLSDNDSKLYYGLTVLLYQDGKYFYDEEIVNCPNGKEFRQIGIYRDDYKTVPVVQFYNSTSTKENTVTHKPSNEDVYEVVEQMPSFPGGLAALMYYLSNNINYPAEAEKIGFQGRVMVSFIVERDGSISNATIEKKVDPILDQEALVIVKSMPRWNPGMQAGKPVRVRYTVPVTFRLQ